MAREHGIGVIGIRSHAAGALADTLDRPVTPGSDVARDFARTGSLAFLKKGPYATLSRAALRYCLDHPDIATVVPGAKNVAELEEAVACADLPPLEAGSPEPEHMDLSIAFEDAHLIVIDKPAGLVVHPGAGHATGTLVNALLAHCGGSLRGIGGVKRPGIVHRLDKDTSGLIVVAKSDLVHRALSEQFASHGADGRLSRRYLAVVWGVPLQSHGRIDAPLARSQSNRTKIAVVRGDAGRHAVTHYDVIDTFDDAKGKPLAALIDCRLETGRTHQIRVHLAHIGHPLMGDQTYGAHFAASARRLDARAQAALAGLGRQALHAAHLGFEHPVTNKAVHFDSALPTDLAALVDALRGQ